MAWYRNAPIASRDMTDVHGEQYWRSSKIWSASSFSSGWSSSGGFSSVHRV